jgi:hypothetical protein
VGIIVKGVASQTADLQQWQNSAGTIGTYITSSGQLASTRAYLSEASVGPEYTTGTQGYLKLATYITTKPQLTVRAIASQTASMTEWQNSAGSALSYVDSAGKIFANGLRLDGSDGSNNHIYKTGTIGLLSGLGIQLYLNQDNNATGGPLVIRAINAQTSNLTEWKNVAGNVLSNITSFGGARLYDLGIKGGPEGIAWAYFGNDNTSTKNVVVRGFASQTASLQEWQDSAGTVMGRIDGQYGTIRSISGIDLTNTYTGSSTITARVNYPNTIPVIIIGAASQTANLQQWQNSAGTVLAKITASGALDATAITVNGSAISGGLSPVAVSTNITMVASTRYFVDTASARILTLPATPALGAEIELYDASNNAFTNNVSILRNGEKINGLTDDAALDINGFAVSFIYTGSTYGWRIK